MQTLSLYESTPRSESRLKSLFWPSIQTAHDVDYLGVQGYWVCTLVAALSCIFTTISGHAVMGLLSLLFYYMGGVGVRERNLYAAVIISLMFTADLVVAIFLSGWLGGPIVFRILVAALLLSNLRATWIASQWRPESEEAALPPRLGQTWTDKFSDQFPQWLWPKVRVLYYVFGAGFTALVMLGLFVMALGLIAGALGLGPARH